MQLVSNGAIGEVSLVRTTCSSMGPESGLGAPTDFSWFYQGGAGGMSSMTGYGLIRMTAVLVAVKSLAATSCISMPERVMRDGSAKGKRVQVDVLDNNVMVLDFGNNTLGTMDTGYVMMASEAPDMELFGTEGVISTYGGDQVDRIRLYRTTGIPMLLAGRTWTFRAWIHDGPSILPLFRAWPTLCLMASLLSPALATWLTSSK